MCRTYTIFTKKGKTRKTKISLFSLKSKTCIDFGHKKNKRCRRFNDFPHTNPPRAPYITTATLTRLLYAPSLTLSRARHASSKDVVFIVVFIVVVVGYVVVSPASKARHSTSRIFEWAKSTKSNASLLHFSGRDHHRKRLRADANLKTERGTESRVHFQLDNLRRERGVERYSREQVRPSRVLSVRKVLTYLSSLTNSPVDTFFDVIIIVNNTKKMEKKTRPKNPPLFPPPLFPPPPPPLERPIDRSMKTTTAKKKQTREVC